MNSTSFLHQSKLETASLHPSTTPLNAFISHRKLLFTKALAFFELYRSQTTTTTTSSPSAPSPPEPPPTTTHLEEADRQLCLQLRSILKDLSPRTRRVRASNSSSIRKAIHQATALELLMAIEREVVTGSSSNSSDNTVIADGDDGQPNTQAVIIASLSTAEIAAAGAASLLPAYTEMERKFCATGPLQSVADAISIGGAYDFSTAASTATTTASSNDSSSSRASILRSMDPLSPLISDERKRLNMDIHTILQPIITPHSSSSSTTTIFTETSEDHTHINSHPHHDDGQYTYCSNGIYGLRQAPGVYIIPGALSNLPTQEYWILKCLRDYIEPPNRRNIDIISVPLVSTTSSSSATSSTVSNVSSATTDASVVEKKKRLTTHLWSEYVEWYASSLSSSSSSTPHIKSAPVSNAATTISDAESCQFDQRVGTVQGASLKRNRSVHNDRANSDIFEDEDDEENESEKPETKKPPHNTTTTPVPPAISGLSWATLGYQYDWTARAYHLAGDDDVTTASPTSSASSASSASSSSEWHAPFPEELALLCNRIIADVNQALMACNNSSSGTLMVDGGFDNDLRRQQQQQVSAVNLNNTDPHSQTHHPEPHPQLVSPSPPLPLLNLDCQAGIVNLYRASSSTNNSSSSNSTRRIAMGGHRDDLERSLQHPVVSISLGCPCVFLVGGATKASSPVYPIILRSGDVVILSGESRLAYHGVPQVYPCTCATPTGVNASSASPGCTCAAQLPPLFCSPPQLPPLPLTSSSSSSSATTSPHGVPYLSEQRALLKFIRERRININVRQVVE